MLDSLKEKGKILGHDLGHAWDLMSEGWRELSQRLLGTYPHWSLLAGEVEETEREIIVRLEVPGMEKEDCRVKIDGNLLFVSGEKHFEQTSDKSNYHVMERAYGSFQRVIPLPKNVVEAEAEATYRNGVLIVRVPKHVSAHTRAVPVS
jgi:HSP20 family protein